MSTSLKETSSPGPESSALASAIIPTYNCCVSLERALDSVLGQTFMDFELIVVDDGSKDGPTDLLDTSADRIKLIR